MGYPGIILCQYTQCLKSCRALMVKVSLPHTCTEREKQHKLLGYIGIISVWNADLKNNGQTIDYKRIWNNISPISRNCNHQLIQNKMVQRYYLSASKRHKLRIISRLICSLCNQKTIGTYSMCICFFECTLVKQFWSQVMTYYLI